MLFQSSNPVVSGVFFPRSVDIVTNCLLSCITKLSIPAWLKSHILTFLPGRMLHSNGALIDAAAAAAAAAAGTIALNAFGTGEG
jgi:hypothetical protein